MAHSWYFHPTYPNHLKNNLKMQVFKRVLVLPGK